MEEEGGLIDPCSHRGEFGSGPIGRKQGGKWTQWKVRRLERQWGDSERPR